MSRQELLDQIEALSREIQREQQRTRAHTKAATRWSMLTTAVIVLWVVYMVAMPLFGEDPYCWPGC